MSEPKGPFDDAIRILHEAKGEAILVDEELVEVQLDAAIRVLEDWPKWEPLIEAAGKVDKHTVLSCFDCAWEYCFTPFACDVDNTGKACQCSKMSIRVLLDVLPDERKK